MNNRSKAGFHSTRRLISDLGKTSPGSITNRCSKLVRYVYEIPNTFIGRILQAEPKKLVSVVKLKTHHALGIAVDFVGDHLKNKKTTEFNTLDKLLSDDLGLLIPFPTIQVISPESVKCALKIWNAVELPRFLKANLICRSRC